MKKTTKLIVMLAVIAMLLGVLAVATADDKIYTSPVFVIPLDRVDMEIPEEAEPEPETAGSEETAEEEPETAEQGEAAGDESETGESEETAGEASEETEPEEAEPEEAAGDESEAAGAAEEGSEAAQAEQPEETKPEETKAAPEKPKPVERQVKIRSSRKAEVIRDEIITLSSELIGFDGVEVQYQWQVDRGDGAGWVDLEGATGPKHTYVANPVTVLYSWRLMVIVDE